ncbi:MAG: ThiF family adenylyltransferase [Pyrinomonadaceae bacterium]
MENRYSRQILFTPIGRLGQEKLRNSRVLLIGCGALGASHAEALTRAGVGFLRIIDRDFVELSNLQRQTLFSEADAAARIPKAIAAKNRLEKINSDIEIEALVADINASNIERFIDGIDLIIDGADNFQVRYLVNDAAVKHCKTWIYGAAVSSYGTTMTIIPNQTACLRCIFEEIPPAGSSPTCDTAGVIQPIISAVSSVQISEALKILTENFDKLHGSLLQIDVWENDQRKISPSAPNPECPACGKREFEFLKAENNANAASLCGRNAVQIVPMNRTEIEPKRFAEKLGSRENLTVNDYLIRFTADNLEITLFKDARAIIRGTDDVAVARSAYAKFIGN